MPRYTLKVNGKSRTADADADTPRSMCCVTTWA